MAEKPLRAESLRPAGFRDVAFFVADADLGVGRRTQLHEYPQRDEPWVEDLGRAARELSVTGFLIGDDYVNQANRLLAALEKPGPGTLVHPWLGTLTVSLKDLARVAFDHALGQARLTMAFVESGELSFPIAGQATQAQSRLAASGLETAAVEGFADRFTVDGFQDFVTDAATGNLSSALSVLGGNSVPGLAALGYATRAADALVSSLALLNNPLDLGWTLANAVGIAGSLGAVMRWPALVRSLVRLAQHQDLSSGSAPSRYTPSRQQAYVNAEATNALMRQTVLAQAVGVSSLVPADVHDETVTVRNELAAALDQESLTAPDAVFDSLQEARSLIWKDLTERGRDSARLSTLTPPGTTPALVLAYDLYEDAGRDTDLVARNRIRHPGFVPANPIKVLTR